MVIEYLLLFNLFRQKYTLKNAGCSFCLSLNVSYTGENPLTACGEPWTGYTEREALYLYGLSILYREEYNVRVIFADQPIDLGLGANVFIRQCSLQIVREKLKNDRRVPGFEICKQSPPVNNCKSPLADSRLHGWDRRHTTEYPFDYVR